MSKFLVLVIDSFGVGAMDDVPEVRPQDIGANTCGHILQHFPELRLPTLEKLGLINALGFAANVMQANVDAVYGTAALQHEGGDTLYGPIRKFWVRGHKLRYVCRFSAVIDDVERELIGAGWQG
ncbi:putative mutase [Cedecea neteri]|uniref:Putative mutase n=1 Tax=Cedecea neteri TaxID=158822 RepID=A0A2X2T9I2_9ENTR|nr:putative mutase [Cedecea neteri]